MEKSLKINHESKLKNTLAPSRSTAYVSNLPFSFTNCDLFKIFEKYGKIIRITILKDKKTRKSRGVAFILFGDQESALSCVKAVDGQEMFGRTLRANIAKDNGRASEFIRRKEYPDKSRCYECGEGGHLSYACPKNILGERDPPPPKKRKLKAKLKESKNLTEEEEESADGSEEEEDDTLSLSAAIRYQVRGTGTGTDIRRQGP
ncbi:UNVERIFIED_CONTAM: hypothetical protein GTU68_041188 [Idotea baltica]|nr:hypothetical protein [Idotea baltica]